MVVLLRPFPCLAVALAAAWRSTDEEQQETRSEPESRTLCVPPAMIFRAGDAVRVRNLTENLWLDGVVSVAEPLTVWLPEPFLTSSSWTYVVPLPLDDGSIAPLPRCREDSFDNPTECADLADALSQELHDDGRTFSSQLWDIYRYVGLFYMFVALVSIGAGIGFWRLALRGRDWKKSMTPRGSLKGLDLTIIKWTARLPAFARSTAFIGGSVALVAVFFMGIVFLVVRKQLYESSRLTDGHSAGAAAAFAASLGESLVGNVGGFLSGELAVPIAAANPTYAELQVDSFSANVLQGAILVSLSQRVVLGDHRNGCFELVAHGNDVGSAFFNNIRTGGGLLQLMRNVSGAAVVDVSFVVRGLWHGQGYQVKCTAVVPFSVAELEEFERASPWYRNLKTVKRSLLKGLRVFHERGETVLQRRTLEFEGSAPAKVRLMWMGSVLALSLTMGVAGCLCCHFIEARKMRQVGGESESADLKGSTSPSPQKVPSDLRAAGQPGRSRPPAASSL